MTKVTSDHLARAAYVYVRQSTADQLLRNHESRRRQYGLAERREVWVGGRSSSSTTISGVPARASAVLVSSGFWRRSAKDASARCLRSRRRAWRAMAVIGTR